MIADRELCRKYFVGEGLMEKVYVKCCGVDIHKKLIVACFKQGRRKQEIREFGATMRELLEMAEWLGKGGCEQVAMESTASYWKPVYNILESAGLGAMVGGKCPTYEGESMAVWAEVPRRCGCRERLCPYD